MYLPSTFIHNNKSRSFYNTVVSGLKVLYSLIGPGNRIYINVDNIFAAPKFDFLKRNISSDNAFSFKTDPIITLVWSVTVSTYILIYT